MISRAPRSTMLGQKAWLYNTEGPRIINISPLDNACFYNCAVCPFSVPGVREKYGEREEMRFETLRQIVGAVPDDPSYAFDISAFGETLLFGGLAEFVGYIKARRPNVPVTISTNGVFLSPDLMAGLITAGLDRLQVSLFAHEPASYRRLTGATVEIERVEGNVKVAMSVKKRMNAERPEVQVFILGIRELEEEFAPFLSYWSEVVDRAFIRPVYNACMELRVTPTHEASEERYPCIAPWYAVSVNAIGDVRACYFHNFYREGPIAENVNERPLLGIWKGERMNAFRRMHAHGRWDDDGLCARCDLWSAYTDVWDRGEGGVFRCKKRLRDLFKVAPSWRGG